MRSRGLVVVLALILASIATAGVFLYSQGVKEDAIEGGDLHDVIVSKVDIPANTPLDQLISEEQFSVLQVPADALVEGAVTDLSQLRGRTTTAYIVAGEQIPAARVQGGIIPGGILGIPEGHQAVAVSMGGPRAIAGALAGGDHVSIYATFDDVSLTILNKNFLKGADDPNQLASLESADVPEFDTTVVLVPEVEVLRVSRDDVVLEEDGSTSSQSASGNVTLTLAFLPEEAQQFVFAIEQGRVYLSLLPPDEPGVDLEPLTVAQVFMPEKTK
jgi:Flp pilus assembly protein CpaB